MRQYWNIARYAAVAALVCGLTLATVVVGYFNFGAVLAAMRPIGFVGFLTVILLQLALYAPLGLAWWRVAANEPPGRVGVFIWGSAMAEAAANLLPFSQFGAAVIASRAVMLRGVSRPEAFGSNVVDVTMELAAQVVYTLIGIVILAIYLGIGNKSDPLLPALAAVSALAAAVVGALIAIERKSLSLVRRMLPHVLPAADRGADVAAAIEEAYRRPRRLLTCFAIHLFGWIAAAGASWIILYLIGRPLPVYAMLAIESLALAIRNIVFVAPAGLGVQEGAYAFLGPLFGLPAEAALALSLLKRGRDIVIGVPMLLSWQVLEGRRSMRRLAKR